MENVDLGFTNNKGDDLFAVYYVYHPHGAVCLKGNRNKIETYLKTHFNNRWFAFYTLFQNFKRSRLKWHIFNIDVPYRTGVHLFHITSEPVIGTYHRKRLQHAYWELSVYKTDAKGKTEKHVIKTFRKLPRKWTPEFTEAFDLAAEQRRLKCTVPY